VVPRKANGSEKRSGRSEVEGKESGEASSEISKASANYPIVPEVTDPVSSR